MNIGAVTLSVTDRWEHFYKELWVLVGTSSSFTGVKLAGAWSWPSDAKVKNEWSYTPIPPYAFVACTRQLHTDLMCGKLIRTMPWHGTGNHLPFCFLGGHVRSQASHVEFVVDKVAVVQVFLSVVHIPPVIVILPVLHTHSFIYQRCNITFPIDSVVREQISREIVSSWAPCFSEHCMVCWLHSICQHLATVNVHMSSTYDQPSHCLYTVITCHVYWSRHFQVTGFSSCFDANVDLLKNEVLSRGEWLHTEDDVMK